MAASLAPIALRLLPAVGGAAAGGAVYEAVEQGIKRIKNRATGHRSSSRSRSQSKKRHDDRDRRRRRHSSRSHSSSPEPRPDPRRHDSLRHERDNHSGSRRRPGSRQEDPRYWTYANGDGGHLDAQTGAMILKGGDDSESDEARRRPRTSNPQRAKLPRRTTHPPPGPSNSFDPRSPLNGTPPVPEARGFSSEAEYRVYQQAAPKSSDTLHRQSIHPMTAEVDKRVARRIILERGWRPQTPLGTYGQSLTLPRRQALEGNTEQLYSPEELRAQRTTAEQQPAYAQGRYEAPYYSDHDERGDNGRPRRGPYPYMESETSPRSHSQQARNPGGRWPSYR